MPLDITFVNRAFEENPDPEKLQKILDEMGLYFIQEVAEYLDKNGELKVISPEESARETPTFIVLMKIMACEHILSEIGWPVDHKKMLDDFIFGLYKCVGLHQAENWK